jgi:hypothetical protein
MNPKATKLVFRQTKPVCPHLLIFRLAPILKSFGKHFNPVVYSSFPLQRASSLISPGKFIPFFLRATRYLLPLFLHYPCPMFIKFPPPGFI